MYCDSIQDLKKLIMASDLEAVEKLVPTLEVDQQTKDALIVLANDAMTMRLKTMQTWELHDFNFGSIDFKFAKLPAHFISGKDAELLKILEVVQYCGIGICALGFLQLFIQLQYDNLYKKYSEDRFPWGGFFMFCGCGTLFVSALIKSLKTVEFAHKRFNQLYENSIQIKQLMYTLKVVS
jgi:hypothetical protein